MTQTIIKYALITFLWLLPFSRRIYQDLEYVQWDWFIWIYAWTGIIDYEYEFPHGIPMLSVYMSLMCLAAGVATIAIPLGFITHKVLSHKKCATAS